VTIQSQSATTSDPATKWKIYGRSYSPQPLVEFSLNFLGRDWFGAGLKGSEALTFARLMLAMYAVQAQGLLMSKKDAMRAIGAEHVATTKRYADLAVDRGMLRIETSQLDRRVELLVLTEAGVRAVEKELETISHTIQWVEAARGRGSARAHELHRSITVSPPRLEQLTIVDDPLPPPSQSPDQGLPERPPAPPKTFARYNAAYSETLRLIPNNFPALNSRLENYRWLGEYENALADANRLEELQPGNHLARRADIYVQLEKFDLAIADIDRLMQLEPGTKYPRITRAKAYAGKGEWQAALDDIRAVYEDQEKGLDDVVRLRGFAHAALGHTEAALEDLTYAYEKTMEYIHNILRDPDYHETFSTGEEYRQQEEEHYVKQATYLEKLIIDLERQVGETKGR
jgi:tetratricopeptide (TPR) repeat protein